MLQETEQKRAIFTQGAYILMVDSLTGEIINPDFLAIDSGHYERIQRAKQYTPRLSRTEQRINAQLEGLKQGKKIILGCF